MAYLYRLRTTRYSRLPATGNTNQASLYGQTALDQPTHENDWDADIYAE